MDVLQTYDLRLAVQVLDIIKHLPLFNGKPPGIKKVRERIANNIGLPDVSVSEILLNLVAEELLVKMNHDFVRKNKDGTDFYVFYESYSLTDKGMILFIDTVVPAPTRAASPVPSTFKSADPSPTFGPALAAPALVRAVTAVCSFDMVGGADCTTTGLRDVISLQRNSLKERIARLYPYLHLNPIIT